MGGVIIGQMLQNFAKISYFTSFGGIIFGQAKSNFEVNTGCKISIVLLFAV